MALRSAKWCEARSRCYLKRQSCCLPYMYEDAGRVGRKEYEKLREGYEKVRKGLILGGRLHNMPEIARWGDTGVCFTVTVTLSITEGYIKCNHSPYTQDVSRWGWLGLINHVQENALKVSVEDLFLTFVFLSSRIVLWWAIRSYLRIRRLHQCVNVI